MFKFSKRVNFGVNHYNILVDFDYKFYFSLVKGQHQDGRPVRLYDDFLTPTTTTAIFQVKEPIKVIRGIIRELRSYLYEHKPPYLIFTAEEESRQKLYKRICKYIDQDNKYKTVFSDDGYFMLVKYRRCNEN